jgi:uncharacterized protein YukE
MMEVSIDKINTNITKLSEVFQKTNTSMDYIQKYESWTGKTSETIFNKYNELKNNYESVEYSLQTMNNFLIGVKDAYINFDEYIKTEIADSDLDM